MKENIPNALKLLKKSVDEDIPRLKTLKYNKTEYLLWVEKILTILKETFRITDVQYQEFLGAADYMGTYIRDRDNRKLYLDRLNIREICLKKIIQNHEVKELLTAPRNGQIQAPVDGIQMATSLFDEMQFHPLVVEASKSRFESGHYSDAIFAAFKAVDNFVKKKTSLSIYGKDLMAKVFNEDNPIIKLNELRTKSNRDEQEGFRFLFMGAMEGIRNPKAHDEVAELDPYKTLEYLGLASLLMRRAEEGKLVRTRKNQPKS